MKSMYLLLLLPALLAACSEPSSSPKVLTDEAPKEAHRAQDSSKNTGEQIPFDSAYIFSKEYLMGKFDPAKQPEFVRFGKPYADEEGYYLHRLTFEAFAKMYEAAKKDGIRLTIISATRPFTRQKSIWESKWTGRRPVEGQNLAKAVKDPVERAKTILRYSSMPGTSRHHWGTDVDLNALENSYFEQGRGLKEYQWLQAHAAEYGFCQVYTAKGPKRPYGYEEEKWHWSYLPLAKKLTALAKTELKDEDISGFAGAETAMAIQVVEHYVLGINPDCL